MIMNKTKTKEKIKRLNLFLSEEMDATIRNIAEKTGLKLTTIVEQGIKMMKEKYGTKE